MTVNANECLMTRVQQMSMDYHFKVEQESGSTSCAFFGYNGIILQILFLTSFYESYRKEKKRYFQVHEDRRFGF